MYAHARECWSARSIVDLRVYCCSLTDFMSWRESTRRGENDQSVGAALVASPTGAEAKPERAPGRLCILIGGSQPFSLSSSGRARFPPASAKI